MIHLALSDVPVSDAAMRVLAADPLIAGCLIVGAGRVVAFGPACTHLTLAAAQNFYPDAHAGWLKGSAHVSGRVQRAVALVAAGSTPNAAAKQVGVNASAVYRAQALRETRAACPCCGHITTKT